MHDTKGIAPEYCVLLMIYIHTLTKEFIYLTICGVAEFSKKICNFWLPGNVLYYVIHILKTPIIYVPVNVPVSIKNFAVED